MKRMLALCLLLAVVLIGCGKTTAVPAPTQATTPETTVPETTIPETTVPETTVPETTVPETTVPETTVPETTEPEHTAFYIPGIPVEDVLVWFNEVCLDSEFVTAGDPSFVQKWDSPIFYMIHGEATEEDRDVLEDFALWLNTVEGFPGISETQNTWEANLNIYFTDEQGLINIMGPNYTGLDGAVTFWYDGADVIYNAVICIRTDIDQEVRNSVILEEVYNGLGPVQDTDLRPDSLIWQGYSIPQALTAVDELILQLLYHPDIRCGMNAAECETVIRSLYG